VPHLRKHPLFKFSSAIYTGVVMHHRFRPKKHRFIYRVFSFCLDLDELPILDNKLRFFSLNRFNLFSFHEKDHGKGDKKLKKQITEILHHYGYGSASSKVRLLCYPRILGYVFNPLSVYFCYDEDEELQVILYEVSNTFGKRHTYLLPVEGKPSSNVRHFSNKQLYVSPFMPMETNYSFRISPPSESVCICIQQQESNQQATTEQITTTKKPVQNSSSMQGKKILNALFSGKKENLSDTKLFRLFLSHPLMTLKVITAIHWEAVRLWLKGMSLQHRNKHEAEYSLSWTDNHGVTHYEVL